MGLLSPPAGQYAFGAWLAGAVCAARLRIRLPVAGTPPIWLAIILVGVAELSILPAVALACACGLAQFLEREKGGYELRRMGLECARAGLAAWAAHAAYRLPHGATAVFFMLLPAAVAYLLSEAVLSGRRPQPTLQHLAAPALSLAVLVTALLYGWPAAVFLLAAACIIQRLDRLHLRHAARRQMKDADLHWRMVEALAVAIEAKDGTTHGHLRRVQTYAGEIGRRLRLSPEEMTSLRTAALLHDIGKLAIPEYIISKPGKLTREEFEKMKIHTVVGAEILQRVGFPSDVAAMVRAHHERWNGMGYPDGISGTDIPLGARILAAVDFIDALSSERQYRRALPLEKAVEMLVAESGRSFDAAIVAIIAESYRDLERVARQQDAGPKLSRPMVIRPGAAPGTGLDLTGAGQPPREDAARLLARARDEFTTLLMNADTLHSVLATADILAIAVARLKRLVPFDTLAIYAVGTSTLEPIHAAGEEENLYGALAIPAGMGVSGWVADNARAIVNANPVMEIAHLKGPCQTGMRAALSVPLDKSGNVLGVLSLYRAEPDSFNEDDLRAAEMVRAVLAELLEARLRIDRRQGHTRVHQVPALSPILERLHDEIERARWNGCAVSLLVMAGLPPVTTAGEVPAISEMAGRALRAACREDDYMAQLPDGRLFMILPGATRTQLALRHQQFRAAAGSAIPGPLAFASASFPEDGAEAATLIALAEEALAGHSTQGEMSFLQSLAPTSPMVQ